MRYLTLSCLVSLCIVYFKIYYSHLCWWLVATSIVFRLHNFLMEYYICVKCEMNIHICWKFLFWKLPKSRQGQASQVQAWQGRTKPGDTQAPGFIKYYITLKLFHINQGLNTFDCEKWTSHIHRCQRQTYDHYCIACIACYPNIEWCVVASVSFTRLSNTSTPTGCVNPPLLFGHVWAITFTKHKDKITFLCLTLRLWVG